MLDDDNYAIRDHFELIQKVMSKKEKKFKCHRISVLTCSKYDRIIPMFLALLKPLPNVPD